MTTMLRSLLLAGVALCAAATASCQREDPLAAPALHFGADACAECHMIVSDNRYGAALSMRDEHGRVAKPVFDDIGCLFLHELHNPERPVLARHVRDATGQAWLDAHSAVYLHSDDLQTPMAFGLAAHATRAAAQRHREQFPGRIITFDQARAMIIPDAPPAQRVP